MSRARCHLCEWEAQAPTKRSAIAMFERHYLTEHPSEQVVPF